MNGVPDMTLEAVHVQLEFNWRSLGQIQPDRDGRLRFPTAPQQPGLYRFRLCANGIARHYVGETDDLRRRFQNYRTPGNSQQTNIRMNCEFRDHLTVGGNIEVDVAVDGINVVAGANPVPVDLANKDLRRLLEHGALVEEAAVGAMLLNR